MRVAVRPSPGSEADAIAVTNRTYHGDTEVTEKTKKGELLEYRISSVLSVPLW